jgi:c-di-GMP-binding flagellar brake protein YcgR
MSSAANESKIYSLSILNMSQGGIQIRQKRKEYQGLKKGDEINLCQIVGLKELVTLSNITMRVMWIMDNEYLDHVIMGVAFVDLTGDQLKALQSFVKKHLTRSKEIHSEHTTEDSEV